MEKFIGREAERKTSQETLGSAQAELVAVYGESNRFVRPK
jgi:hypothetical protein